MKNQILLKSVVTRVASKLLPVAVLKHSFFVNDIAPELQIETDEQVVAAIIRKCLLQELLVTEDACIRISASTDEHQLYLVVHQKSPFVIRLN